MKAKSAGTWFSLDLGDGVLAAAACSDLEEKFQPLFVAAGKPADMAILKRHDNDNSLHCTVTAYFSPASADLAIALGATPCAKPGRHGLELIVGTLDAWSTLFPQS
jgi:hypothetical protein